MDLYGRRDETPRQTRQRVQREWLGELIAMRDDPHQRRPDSQPVRVTMAADIDWLVTP